MKKIRIGSGAGYAGDRIEPAIKLVEQGKLDYIIFECLAERTIALAQREKKKDKTKGYNGLLEYRMRKIVPLLKEHPVKIITNMGAANPLEAAKITNKICVENNLSHLKIACVYGDDIFEKLRDFRDEKTIESGRLVHEILETSVSANAYIGAQSIVDALKENADIIITGRVSDPSLTVGPLVYEFNKSFDNYNFLAKATVAGHILECGGQVTGGYYACPPQKTVPDLWNIGFPIVEFFEIGDFTIEKLPETGGILNSRTVKEQLIYEIHDPENYLTPDVVVDFSNIIVDEQDDKVAVKNISGKKATGLLKTSIGYNAGFIAEGEISYGGEKAYELANLANEILNYRMNIIDIEFEDKREDYIGLNSLYGKKPMHNFCTPIEIRFRSAIRTNCEENAKEFCQEFESLYTNGPAGGGGIRTRMNEVVAIESILVDAKIIKTEFKLI